MAEGIFKTIVANADLSKQIQCDSSGVIGYHAGELPDSRMRQTAKEHDIILTHKSRQITTNDLNDFDYILGMDESNMNNIRQMVKNHKNTSAKIFKMREFDANNSSKDVEDPYYLKDEGFEVCYQVLLESSQNFLNYIVDKKQLVKVDK
jgi:protein-tyrosine phosphatase